MGYQVEIDLKLGHAAEMILEIAETRKPDLIALGAKGLRSTVGILLGGVAQQMVEYACCPVLVVRPPCHRFCNILLVTDGSPSSQSAARYLGKLHLPEGAAVHVMHVLPPLQPAVMMEPYLGAWQTVYGSYPMTEDMDAKEKKKRILGKRSSPGPPACSSGMESSLRRSWNGPTQ